MNEGQSVLQFVKKSQVVMSLSMVNVSVDLYSASSSNASMCSVLFDVYDGRVNTHARPVHTDCHANTGVKVEMKRRWNYKIPWAPYKIFWAPTLLAGPLKFACQNEYTNFLVKILIN